MAVTRRPAGRVRRDLWIVAGLAAYISIWFLTLVPPTDAETVLGGVILQSLCVAPMVFAVRRWLAGRRALRLVEVADLDDQAEIASAAPAVDEVVERMRRLVGELETWAERRAGERPWRPRSARPERSDVCEDGSSS